MSSKQAPKSKLFVKERKIDRDRERERGIGRERRVFLLMLNFRNVIRQPHSLNFFLCVSESVSFARSHGNGRKLRTNELRKE